MNPAFNRHAAYLSQAWRTLEDSVLLKTPLQGNALRNHQASGCTGCRKCDSDKQDILKPQIPVKDVPKVRGPVGPTTNVKPLTPEEQRAQEEMRARILEQLNPSGKIGIKRRR